MPKIAYGTHTPETLRRISEQLQVVAENLGQLSVKMTAEGVESLEIGGQTEVERALDRLPAFCDNANAMLRVAMLKRGSFGIGTNGPSVPPTAKKSPPKKARKGK